MANIASGWITIEPASEKLYEDLCTRIARVPMFFCYGDLSGQADIEFDGTKISVTITSRWECSDAWDFFDDLLGDAKNKFRSELIASEIHGRGWETAGRYHEGIRKLEGETILKRRRK